MLELNKIYHGNCLDIMKLIDDESIDLTITSPPYDNLRTYNGYLFDFENIAKELYRITKNGGVIVWIVGDATINGSETGTSFKQVLYFKDIGFNLHDTMIWKKTNPMPKIKTKRYFDVFEFMFILSVGKPRTFNPIMQKCKFGGEVYNSTCKQISKNKKRIKKTFTLNEERYKDNIWEFSISKNKTNHPAVFPENLIKDHIYTWSNYNDIVFDPFIGSGTTAIAAKKMNRNYIGCDISKEYINIANDRLSQIFLEL